MTLHTLIFNLDKDLPKQSDLKATYLQNRVLELQKIPTQIQKSPEWYSFRNGILTASTFGQIVKRNSNIYYEEGYEVVDSNTDLSYITNYDIIKDKCGESTYFTSIQTDWGNKYEDVAVLIYENRNNTKIINFGCLRHDSINFLGASPDGITSQGVMVEIKCVYSRKITGIPKYTYWAQVQGQLEVCDLDRCDFIECEIKEYIDENEYLLDSYEGDFTLNKYGNEKGVIAKYFRKSDKKYIYYYSPLSILNDSLIYWQNSIKTSYQTNDVVFSGFEYWNLKEVSCIPIYRNHAWFNTAKYELEKFWNKVLYYQSVGLNILKENYQIQQEQKQLIKSTILKNPKNPKKIIKTNDANLSNNVNLSNKLTDINMDINMDIDMDFDMDFNTNVSMFT